MQGRDTSAKKVWLNEKQVAERLNVSVKWLQAKRLRGDGIPFAKFGASVRYPLAALEDFEQQSLRSSTSQTLKTGE